MYQQSGLLVFLCLYVPVKVRICKQDPEYVFVCMHIGVCVSEVALYSAVQQSPLPTHGFTPPHSDTVMSHMLHSYTFVLTVSYWDILTRISLSHTHTQHSEELSMHLPQKIHIGSRMRRVLNVFSFSSHPSQMCLCGSSHSDFGLFGSWWTPQQPLYVNSAVTRPASDISKIVPVHSHQMAATQ